MMESNKSILSNVLSYCANQVAKEAAKIDKEHAYTYARYLQNYAKRMKMVAGVLAPWIKRCGKVPPIEVPNLNQLFTAELVKLAGGTVYTVTKTVTTTSTLSLVTFIQGTTVIPVAGSPRISLATTVYTNPFVSTVTKTVTMYNRVTTVSLVTKTVTETKTFTAKPSEEILKKVISLKDQIEVSIAKELIRKGVGPKCAYAVADVLLNNFIDLIKEKTGIKNVEYALTIMACNTPDCLAKALVNMIQEEVLPISPEDLLELSPCANDLGLQPWLKGTVTVTSTKYLTVSTVIVRPKVVTITQPLVVTKPVTVTVTQTLVRPRAFKAIVQLSPNIFVASNGTYYFNTAWSVKGTVFIFKEFPGNLEVPPELAVPKEWVALVNGQISKNITLPKGSYLDISIASLNNATVIVNGKAYEVPKRWTELVIGPLEGGVQITIRGKALVDYVKVYSNGIIMDEEFALLG